MSKHFITRLHRLYEESLKGKLGEITESGDGKRAFISLKESDGWEDFRIEIDTDDCDSEKALASAEFMRELWNSWPEIQKLLKSL